MGTSGKTKYIEHAAEILWPGGKTANRNLEAVQEKVGKLLLGASAKCVLCDEEGRRGAALCDEFEWKRQNLLKRTETLRVQTCGWRSLRRKTVLGK